MNKTVLRWEWGGALFIILTGSMLHFLFEWTGYFRPIGWLAAVNESVWEHTKLAFWPGLAYAVVEALFIGRQVRNFWLAKFLGLLSIPLQIIVFFYAYTAFLGDHVFLIDMLIFVVAVVVGQMLGARIMVAPAAGRAFQRAGILALAALALLFAVFSYRPPHLPPFQDSGMQQYGILEQNHD